MTDAYISEFNDRILFIEHTFGMKYKKTGQLPRRYQKVGDTSHGLPERFLDPKIESAYGNGCYFNFAYVEDKLTGEWYSYPPSEIIVFAPPVIKKAMTSLQWVAAEHGQTNPFEFTVRNGQIWRKLQIWFEGKQINYKFRRSTKWVSVPGDLNYEKRKI